MSPLAEVSDPKEVEDLLEQVRCGAGIPVGGPKGLPASLVAGKDAKDDADRGNR
jgi:hypothetical protein